MTIEEACKKALKFTGAKAEKSITDAFETDKHYLFVVQSGNELYCSPISVEKRTGKAEVLFPPSNGAEMREAKRRTVPEKYRKGNE